MPDLPSPELNKFLHALEGFLENPPRDLPEGAVESLTEMRQTLKGYTGEGEPSPGQREVVKQARGSDEGVPYPDAAKGPDGPSPGQQEYERAMAQVKEAVDSVGSGSGG